MTDYYAILGVQPDAEIGEIKKQYRKLVKENHPDLHPGDYEAEARFKKIAEAYEILSNPEKRNKYDTERNKKTAAFGGKTPKSNAPMGDVDFADLMGKFDTFFGGAVKPEKGKKQEANPLDASELFEKFMGIKKK